MSDISRREALEQLVAEAAENEQLFEKPLCHGGWLCAGSGAGSRGWSGCS